MTHKNKVLVVEDDPMDRELLLRRLARVPIRVVTVVNGMEAMQAFDRDTFRAVLMNLKLPDIDGLALIRWLKSRKPHVPICIVTGHDNPDTRMKVFEAGAIMLIAKPYESADNEALLSLLAQNHAVFMRGKNMRRSWKTTIFGVVSIVGGAVVLADFGPVATKLALCVASAATGLGLHFARDNNRSSEQVGAGVITPKQTNEHSK